MPAHHFPVHTFLCISLSLQTFIDRKTPSAGLGKYLLQHLTTGLGFEFAGNPQESKQTLRKASILPFK